MKQFEMGNGKWEMGAQAPSCRFAESFFHFAFHISNFAFAL